jgi:hypothetical protein
MYNGRTFPGLSSGFESRIPYSCLKILVDSSRVKYIIYIGIKKA